ncbi:MAG: endonuclease, partial [Clostridia bacterium]|nr:endonuclease [Clostridia bacterium]
MKAKKIVKIIAITLACVIGAAALIIGGYVGYVAVQYYRIEDNFELQTENGRDKKAGLNDVFT